ncbi:origin recognition complex subunit 3-like [Procambarus clarkii]|uniref:origin recognition complex subunit 3-like n=1 Tax=Procambarus clarkii TaxID=6728 RepID=UPI003744791D
MHTEVGRGGADRTKVKLTNASNSRSLNTNQVHRKPANTVLYSSKDRKSKNPDSPWQSITRKKSQNLVETEEFKEADKMLRLMAREELLPILTNILDILREWLHKDEELSVLYDELAVILGRLNSLDQLDQVIDNSPSEELPLNIQSSDRFQLKEKLLEIAKKKNKRPNAYELLRSEVLQLLSNVFELHLQPVNKQPVNEILFFESSSSVKQHLVGMPRAPLTTALSNPHHYFRVGSLFAAPLLLSSMGALAASGGYGLERLRHGPSGPMFCRFGSSFPYWILYEDPDLSSLADCPVFALEI